MALDHRADGMPRIWPAIAFLVAALIVVAWATLYARQTLETVGELTEQRNRAATSRLYLEQTLTLIKDMETGVRGFLITGDDSYLAPYHQASATLPDSHARLKAMLGEGGPEGAGWTALDGQIAERLGLLARSIDGRRQRGEEIIHDSTLLTAGKAAMDRVRHSFARIDLAQQARIASVSEAVAGARRQADRWSAISAALSFCFIALAIALLLREHILRRALEASLRRSNAVLDARVGERTADLARARDRLARFALERERAIESERRRLSREVHDQIGQVFTAIKLIVGSLPRTAFPEGQEAALAQALEMGIASTRKVTAELRPPLLDDLGLAAALEHFAGTLAGHGKLQCHVAVADAERLDADQALALFRIVQEAVTNVLRHAGADRLDISGRAAGTAYSLRIADNGGGFAGESTRPGALGIAGMRERANLLGGDCKIDSNADGTVVDISLPLHQMEWPHEHPAR